MPSSNRWTRASAAEAQASSSSRRRQDFPDSQYHGEERHRSPPGGYAQRKIEEAPSEDKRTPLTLPREDHMAFSAAWFQAQERVRQKRKRDMQTSWEQTTCQVSSTSNVHGCYSSIENLM